MWDFLGESKISPDLSKFAELVNEFRSVLQLYGTGENELGNFFSNNPNLQKTQNLAHQTIFKPLKYIGTNQHQTDTISYFFWQNFDLIKSKILSRVAEKGQERNEETQENLHMKLNYAFSTKFLLELVLQKNEQLAEIRNIADIIGENEFNANFFQATELLFDIQKGQIAFSQFNQLGNNFLKYTGPIRALFDLLKNQHSTEVKELKKLYNNYLYQIDDFYQKKFGYKVTEDPVFSCNLTFLAIATLRDVLKTFQED